MSSLSWYWHRLRAMHPAELAAHGRRKLHQVSDGFFSTRRFSRLDEIPTAGAFPVLPAAESAPELLRKALRQDSAEIRAGRWTAFGYLPLQLDDPPLWHKDYLVGVDMATRQRALKLHHRLQGTADIKLIWEPSRWYSLVRLAQAAYILGDEPAGSSCLRWLEDWARQNPPYYGWHWTSGLESGLRLIQFVWIDALLGRAEKANDAHGAAAILPRLRAAILPPHLWFTWRERSFGSSANNHVLGEFAGLILALARWPDLARWAVPLDTVQPLWEKQVLRQFAPDGGNQEQALNYHLFSWEFCWQARLALLAVGRRISAEVEERLRRAAAFFTTVQSPENAWDYGDSDNAFVTPFFGEWPQATSEWYAWLKEPSQSPALRYWLGDSPKPIAAAAVNSKQAGWQVFPDTGIAICRTGDWLLRWDLSPLGFLSTAGHGHCDALHLSIWFRGQALIIDPGTGVYHSDRILRDYLSSWDAHNGPHPLRLAQPQRMGTFLWSNHHPRPRWKIEGEGTIRADLELPEGVMRRTITRIESDDSWQIDDAYASTGKEVPDCVRVMWQLAPRVKVEAVSARSFRLGLERGVILTEFDSAWPQVELGQSAPAQAGSLATPPWGTCAPAFRKIAFAPFILLQGPAGHSGNLRTTFRGLAC